MSEEQPKDIPPTREQALAYKESLGVTRSREEAESIVQEENS